MFLQLPSAPTVFARDYQGAQLMIFRDYLRYTENEEVSSSIKRSKGSTCSRPALTTSVLTHATLLPPTKRNASSSSLHHMVRAKTKTFASPRNPSPTTANNFILPDLLSHCRFPLIYHPKGDAVAAESVRWLDTHCPDLREKRRRALYGLRAGELTAFCYNTASDERLRIISDFMNYLFHLDNISDGMMTNDTEALSDAVMNALQFTDSKFYCPTAELNYVRLEDELNAAKLARDFWGRCIRGASSGCQSRFKDNLGLFFQAVSNQTKSRDAGVIPDLESYIEIRRNTSGCKPCWALIEYALDIDLPDFVVEDPIIIALNQTTNDLVTWSNDIFSYNVEQSRGDTHNMIVILMKHHGHTLQGPSYHSGELKLMIWCSATCKACRTGSLGCALQPPISSAFGGTYTAATYNSGLQNISITFDFTGTAIYVYFILANNPAPGITATTAANFTLDGSLVGTFNHSPNTSTSAPDFQFNQSALAFSKDGLKNITHQMVISTSGLSEDVWVNFDYALYTFQDATTISSSESLSSSSTNNLPSATASTSSNIGISSSQSTDAMRIGVIIGGAIGGLVVLGALITMLCICHKRRRRRNQQGRANIHVINDLESGSKGSVVVERNKLDPLKRPTTSLSTLDLSSETQHQNAFGSLFSVHKTEIPSETGLALASFMNDGVDSASRRHSHCIENNDISTSAPEYQYRSVISTLPSGRTVMAPGTTQDFLTTPLSSSGNLTGSTFSKLTSATRVVPTGNAASEKYKLRRMRQQELEQQMRAINEEIEELKNEAAERSDPTSTGLMSRTSVRKKKSIRKGRNTDENTDSVAQLKAQIREMSEEILSLQSQQNSAWAQGLSDEPPPGYSPRLVVANINSDE
ncbi:hypothetical protein HHX47_DHR1000254 [Lentinula edodes]|nr:hypothetical protein HHX47_DHR1000254 [Lentinula edodes]